MYDRTPWDAVVLIAELEGVRREVGGAMAGRLTSCLLTFITLDCDMTLSFISLLADGPISRLYTIQSLTVTNTIS